MVSNEYGMAPHGNGAHLHQDVLNERWPTTPRDQWTRADSPIPVTVRIVWAKDGEEHIDGNATRWSGRCVYVEFTDQRLNKTGAWVDAGDVERR